MADERKVRMTSVLGETSVVIGNLKGGGDLEVRGKVQGSVLVKGRVLVSETGTVLGGIEASHVTVEGQVRGDLVALEGVAVTASGHVEGNITAPRVGIDSGACVRGHLRSGAAPAEAPEVEVPMLAPRNAVPEVPNAVPKVPNAVPKVPNAVPKVPNAVPKVASAVLKVPSEVRSTSSSVTDASSLVPHPPSLEDVDQSLEETERHDSSLGHLAPPLESLPPRGLLGDEAAPNARSGRSRPGKRRRGRRSDHEGAAASGGTWKAESGPSRSADKSAHPAPLRAASEFKSTEARQGPPKPLTFVKGAKGHPRG